MSVKARLVDDIDAADAQPGDFEFYKSGDRYPAGMTFVCPCGCGMLGALAFRPHPSPSWEWDGNEAAPTLKPSVHIIPDGKTHWHGWLTGGVWRSV